MASRHIHQGVTSRSNKRACNAVHCIGLKASDGRGSAPWTRNGSCRFCMKWQQMLRRAEAYVGLHRMRTVLAQCQAYGAGIWFSFCHERDVELNRVVFVARMKLIEE